VEAELDDTSRVRRSFAALQRQPPLAQAWQPLPTPDRCARRLAGCPRARPGPSPPPLAPGGTAAPRPSGPTRPPRPPARPPRSFLYRQQRVDELPPQRYEPKAVDSGLASIAYGYGSQPKVRRSSRRGWRAARSARPRGRAAAQTAARCRAAAA
jgi:hypothetical protein